MRLRFGHNEIDDQCASRTYESEQFEQAAPADRAEERRSWASGDRNEATAASTISDLEMLRWAASSSTLRSSSGSTG